jgi:hypothetical protein
VNSGMERKGAFSRALSMVSSGVLMVMAASGLSGATLWDNGVINNTTYTLAGTTGAGNPCDSVCTSAGPATFTIYDNFNLSAGAVINGFDFSDFLVGSSGNLTAPATKTVNWSIWSGDPAINGTLRASGVAIATLSAPFGYGCSGSICLENFQITGLNVTLSAGTNYYLGTSVTVDANQNYATYRATANISPLAGWESFNGSTYTVFPGGTFSPTPNTCGLDHNQPCTGVSSPDSVFDINGTITTAGTPEPGTLTLLGLALVGLCFVRRRAA